MSLKLPFYMAYPMPFAYDDERVERRDYEYMKSLYPETAKNLLPFIEEECDRCECPCSMMYDEYPDRLQLRMMCGRICDKARKELKFDMEKEKALDDRWLGELAEVMLYQELYKRRSDDRRTRRKYY